MLRYALREKNTSNYYGYNEADPKSFIVPSVDVAFPFNTLEEAQERAWRLNDHPLHITQNNVWEPVEIIV
jgi:hypothetical protein